MQELKRKSPLLSTKILVGAPKLIHFLSYASKKEKGKECIFSNYRSNKLRLRNVLYNIIQRVLMWTAVYARSKQTVWANVMSQIQQRVAMGKSANPFHMTPSAR